MELEIGMKLILKDDLDCGVKVINKGEIAEITKISDSLISVEIPNVGVGGFSKEEIETYFEEYIEPTITNNEVKTNNEIKRYFINKEKRTCVVILKTGEKGIAKCLPEDNFNVLIGMRIAYLKAKIKQYNNEIKRY